MPEPLAIRLAVFDCDGTLVDSQHSIVAAMRAACAVHCLEEPPAEQVRRVVGLQLLEAIRVLLPACAEDMLNRVHASYIAAYQDLRAQGLVRDPLYPGAKATIERLEQSGWVLGVATGK